MAVANAPASPLNLPQPPQSWNAGWQQRYTQALTLASQNYITRGNDILLDANTTFTLTSPDGTTQVTIVANDDGTIGPVPAAPADIRPQNNTWTGTNTYTNQVVTTAGFQANDNIVVSGAVGPAVQFINTAVGTSSWELNAGTGGGFNIQAVTSAGVATTMLNCGASAGTPTTVTVTAPTSVTVTSPTITLSGTVSVTNYATATQTIAGTANVFGNPAADWGALAPATNASGSLNLSSAINFYYVATSGQPSATFTLSGGHAGQSGTIFFNNSGNGTAVTLAFSPIAPAAGVNLVVVGGGQAIFSYYILGGSNIYVTRFF